jgi:hypothetical protein
VGANTSAINNANPTAHRIVDQSSRVSVSSIKDGDINRTPRRPRLAGVGATGTCPEVPCGGPSTLSDRSGGLATTVRAHLVRVRRSAGYERATRVSRGQAEFDAAQGMHGPGDTGPGAVVGVVLASTAQVPPSAPVADHPARDDRLRVAGLPYGSLTRRLPQMSYTGKPAPV